MSRKLDNKLNTKKDKKDNKSNIKSGKDKFINANNVVETNELKRLLYIFLVVVALFGLLYLITSFVNKNEAENNEVTIQYDEIIIGELLSQKKDSYYVLAILKDDNNKETYVNYLNTYSSLENSLKYYYIDLSSAFNKQYISEESNIDVTSVKDIRLKDTTLIKVDSGKITSYYEGYDDISSYLEELTK